MPTPRRTLLRYLILLSGLFALTLPAAERKLQGTRYLWGKYLPPD
ncbi:MAG TPA: hypothetical protein PK529_11455 [Verrucomicrobiales bacterium]|nr:hypothetical protein [Verrucomicrobiales bacterium]